MNASAARPVRPLKFGWSLETVLTFVAVFANVVHISRIFEGFSEETVRIAIGLQLLVTGVFILKAFERDHIKAILLTIGWLFYLFLMCVLFELRSGMPYNFNAALTLATMVLCLVFYENRMSVRDNIKIIFICHLTYCILYLALYNFNIESTSEAVLSADEIRGERVFLMGAAAAFVLFSGLNLIKYHLPFAFFCIIVSLMAIYYASSRVFSAVLFVFVVKYLIELSLPRLRSFLSWAVSAVFLLLCLTILAGYAINTWNPYNIIAWDGSGLARYYQFEYAQKYFKEMWLLGMGIPASHEDLQNFVNPNRPFYTSDLGIAGNMLTFGVLFGVALMIVTLLCVAAVPTEAGRRDPLFTAFAQTIQFSAFASFFSVALLGGTGTVFFCVALLMLANNSSVYRIVAGDFLNRARWKIARPSAAGTFQRSRGRRVD